MRNTPHARTHPRRTATAWAVALVLLGTGGAVVGCGAESAASPADAAELDGTAGDAARDTGELDGDGEAADAEGHHDGRGYGHGKPLVHGGDAKRIALDATGADWRDLRNVELDRGGDRVVWRIDVRHDGAVETVVVDADTGEVTTNG